jgi:hypothetical protein
MTFIIIIKLSYIYICIYIYINVVAEEYSLLHVVQTGSGTHPVSPPMDAMGPFQRRKAARE